MRKKRLWRVLPFFLIGCLGSNTALAAVHSKNGDSENPASDRAEVTQEKNFYDDLARLLARKVACPQHPSEALLSITSLRWYLAQILLAGRKYSRHNELPIKNSDDFAMTISWQIQQSLGYLPPDPQIGKFGAAVARIWQKLLKDKRKFSPKSLIKMLKKEDKSDLHAMTNGIRYIWDKYWKRINASKQCISYNKLGDARFRTPTFQQNGHSQNLDADTSAAEESNYRVQTSKWNPQNWFKQSTPQTETFSNKAAVAENTKIKNAQYPDALTGPSSHTPVMNDKVAAPPPSKTELPKIWQHNYNSKGSWALMPAAKFVATPRNMTGGAINPHQNLIIAMHRTACESPGQASKHPVTDGHFTVSKDGTIYQHAPISLMRTHATAGNNPWTINIEFESCYTGRLNKSQYGGVHSYEALTAAQMKAGAEVMAFISKAYASKGVKIPLEWVTDFKSAQATNRNYRGTMLTNGGSGNRRPNVSGVTDHGHLGVPGENGIHHDDAWFDNGNPNDPNNPKNQMLRMLALANGFYNSPGLIYSN